MRGCASHRRVAGRVLQFHCFWNVGVYLTSLGSCHRQMPLRAGRGGARRSCVSGRLPALPRLLPPGHPPSAWGGLSDSTRVSVDTQTLGDVWGPLPSVSSSALVPGPSFLHLLRAVGFLHSQSQEPPPGPLELLLFILYSEAHPSHYSQALP